MDADQFFAYLSPTQRLKVINEKGKDLHLFNESSTNVDESNLDEDEISNSSMSLDQPQALQSGMIIDEEDLDESLICENSLLKLLEHIEYLLKIQI